MCGSYNKSSTNQQFKVVHIHINDRSKLKVNCYKSALYVINYYFSFYNESWISFICKICPKVNLVSINVTFRAFLLFCELFLHNLCESKGEKWSSNQRQSLKHICILFYPKNKTHMYLPCSYMCFFPCVSLF